MFGQQRTGTKVFTVPLKALMFFFARVSIRNYNNSPSPGSTRTDHTINESDVESLKHHVSIIVGEFLRHPLPDNSCKNLEVVLQCRCCCSHERGDPLLLFLFPLFVCVVLVPHALHIAGKSSASQTCSCRELCSTHEPTQTVHARNTQIHKPSV